MARATELEYLTWFRLYADFGPAHSDVVYSLNAQFRAVTGLDLPEEWDNEDE